MMDLKSIIAITWIGGLVPFVAPAQAPVRHDTTAKLALMARYTGQEVRLRWAPGKPGAWTLLNRIGYKIERYELGPKGELLYPTLLSANPVRPEPLEQWKRFAEPGSLNERALVAAQAIYGKKFTGAQSPLTEQADELTNRYSFTLLSADLDFTTAKAAGLGWSDSTALPGKGYLYKLYAAGKPEGYMPVDTTTEVVYTHTVDPLPRPVWSAATENERQVVLAWDKAYHTDNFTAYHIERSSDGRSFTRLNKAPYLNMASDIEDGPEFTYPDSVDNYVPYQYRLIGITPFGEESASETTIQAMARDRTPPAPPTGVALKPLGGKRVEITWEAREEGDLKGFYVGRGSNSLTDFRPLFTQPLPRSARSYIDENAVTDTLSYYVVVSADTAGNAAASLSVQNIASDTIAPPPPTGLRAQIDTSGVLTLRWNSNKEKDLKGYVVFYANQRDHDFTAAVNQVVSDTVFSDTLRLWTLTETIYYQVRAVDLNNNTSQASEMLEVKKPDVVPPVPPVFKGIRAIGKGVVLEWVPSSSDDIARHILESREESTPSFRQLAEFPKDGATTFTDTLAGSGHAYQYRLTAVDDAGNRSPDPPVIRIKLPYDTGPASVTDFRAEINRDGNRIEISWAVPSGGTAVQLYRASGDGGFRTLASVPRTGTSFADLKVSPGQTYLYTAKVVYPNGNTSAFSRVIRISF